MKLKPLDGKDIRELFILAFLVTALSIAYHMGVKHGEEYGALGVQFQAEEQGFGYFYQGEFLWD